MARYSRRNVSPSPFAWTTIFYLLLILIAPLAFVATARAEKEQTPLQENYGTGRTLLLPFFPLLFLDNLRLNFVLVAVNYADLWIPLQ